MSGLSWSSAATSDHQNEPTSRSGMSHPMHHRTSEHELPRPTIWPATLAAGIALIAAGLTTSPFVLAGGALLFVFALRGWVHDLLGESYDGVHPNDVTEAPEDDAATGDTPTVEAAHGVVRDERNG
jgi:hypothetical protein